MQYVPLPVVGGYLGYVGYFCLAAGVSQACNVEASAPIMPLHFYPCLALSHMPGTLDSHWRIQHFYKLLIRYELGLRSPKGFGL